MRWHVATAYSRWQRIHTRCVLYATHTSTIRVSAQRTGLVSAYIEYARCYTKRWSCLGPLGNCFEPLAEGSPQERGSATRIADIRIYECTYWDIN